MRVVVDATAIPANRGGVGRYVDALVPALARQGAEVVVACRPAEVEHFGALSGRDPLAAPGLSTLRPVRLAWEQVGFPELLRRIRPDVLHSPHYTHPLRAEVPLAVTLHDATFFSHAHLHDGFKAPFFRAATRLALRRAGCCIVPSEATAEELSRYAGADRARLQVAHLGVDPAVFSPPSPVAVSSLRARLGLASDQGWIASLGTLEPRKNAPALIRGWIKAALRRAKPPALVLAGASGWDEQVAAAVGAVPSALRLVRPGYLPAGDLSALLGGADVVAYPSLGEGFGLPVLEAMACGAPVLTTRRLALPEIGGDAVLYTEPTDHGIAAALTTLLDDPARRRRLAAAGLTRSALFSWDACAQAHISAYEAASARARRG